MRHQYCLHRGHPLWVIHLRRSGVAGSTATSKRNQSLALTSEETVMVEQDSLGSGKPLTRKGSQQTTSFLCSECDYTTESLFHFRLHLAQTHPDFRYQIRDTTIDSPLKCGYCAFLAETKAEFSNHIESHFSARSFQCAHCDYSAYDRVSVTRHLTSSPPAPEQRVLDLGAVSRMGQEYVKGDEKLKRKDLPLLVNLEPELMLTPLSDSVLAKYEPVLPSDDDNGDDEGVDIEAVGLHIEEDEEDDRANDFVEGIEDDEKDQEVEEHFGEDDGDGGNDNTGEDDEGLMVIEGVSEMDVLGEDESDEEGMGEGEKSRDGHHQEGMSQDLCQDSQQEMSEDHKDEGDEDKGKSPKKAESSDQEELAKHLSLITGQSTSRLDSDMVIMQFGGMSSTISDHNSSADGNEGSNKGVHKSKDSLLSAQQEDEDVTHSLMEPRRDGENEGDEDDDDEDDEFGNDVTLASPLPMISLGDGVAMSPMEMENSELDLNSSGGPTTMEMLESSSDDKGLLDV